jgi:hypothetical protein
MATKRGNVWLKAADRDVGDAWLEDFEVTRGEPIIHNGRRWHFSHTYRAHDLKGDTHVDWLTYVDRGPVI